VNAKALRASAASRSCLDSISGIAEQLPLDQRGHERCECRQQLKRKRHLFRFALQCALVGSVQVILLSCNLSAPSSVNCSTHIHTRPRKLHSRLYSIFRFTEARQCCLEAIAMTSAQYLPSSHVHAYRVVCCCTCQCSLSPIAASNANLQCCPLVLVILYQATGYIQPILSQIDLAERQYAQPFTACFSSWNISPSAWIPRA
jgi:hypothetical protein